MNIDRIIDIVLYTFEETFKKIGVDKKYLHLQVKFIGIIIILNIISLIIPGIPTKFNPISCIIVGAYYFIYYIISKKGSE